MIRAVTTRHSRTRSGRTAGIAAILALCLVLLAACGEGGYVGSGEWSEKSDKVTPEGQTPAPPSGVEPQTEANPQHPYEDPLVRATDLDQPTAIVGLPDDTALVGERTTGNVTRVFAKQGIYQQFMYTIAGIDGSGTGGLLSFALPPNWYETGLIYAYITTATDNRVVSVNGAGVIAPILTGIPKGATRNGGAMAVGPDGTIVVATGDTGNPALASDQTSLAGKILVFDQFGDPIAGESPILSKGFTDPTGLCIGDTGVYVVEAGDESADSALYAVDGSDSMSAASALVEYSGATAGGSGCTAGVSTVFVTGLESTSLMGTTFDGNGEVVGEPALTLTGTYGRLRGISVNPANGVLWIATSNRDGFGQPAIDDDKVIYQEAGGGIFTPEDTI